MSSQIRLAAAAAIGLLLVTSGCTFPEASSNTVEFRGEVETVDGQFRMSGDVVVKGTSDKDLTDVTIALYDDNETVIERVDVGPLSSNSDGRYPTNRSVTVTSDRQPRYVVIESPEVWDSEDATEAFYWTGEGYVMYWVRNEDDRFQNPIESRLP